MEKETTVFVQIAIVKIEKDFYIYFLNTFSKNP